VKRFLALDIETIADEGLVSAVSASPSSPPVDGDVDGEPRRTYDEQLSRLMAARRAQSGGKSDFLPLPYHRPVAACWIEAEELGGVVGLTGVGRWSDEGRDEAAFLAATWERLRGRTLVSFHGEGFDLPVLGLRSLKLGVPAPAHYGSGGVPERHVDLYRLLSRGGNAPAPLDLYAKLVGLPGKEDTAGKDVQRLYAQGALDRIAAYCMTDVVQTWLLFLRWRLLEGTLGAQGYARSTASAQERLAELFAGLRPGERELLLPFLARCEPFFSAATLPPLRQAL